MAWSFIDCLKASSTMMTLWMWKTPIIVLSVVNRYLLIFFRRTRFSFIFWFVWFLSMQDGNETRDSRVWVGHDDNAFYLIERFQPEIWSSADISNLSRNTLKHLEFWETQNRKIFYSTHYSEKKNNKLYRLILNIINHFS